jgi:DNA mismatch repair protein MutS
MPSISEPPVNDTPLLRQYKALKAQNPDAFLLFRLGDFYELFFEDAKRAAPLLEVALTQRQGIPMCGVPHHALSSYLAKLLKKGLCVAVAEQMEDPALAKGMVNREVVRIITPGTLVEEELLDAKAPNFLAAVFPAVAGPWALAALDISTGEFLHAAPAGPEAAEAELARLSPRELLLPAGASWRPASGPSPVEVAPLVEGTAQKRLDELFGERAEIPVASTPALAALLAYVGKNQPSALDNIRPPRYHALESHMLLDDRAVERLDLLPRASSGESASLWEVLDHTVTPMGGRRLKWRLLHPLMDVAPLTARLDQVGSWLDRPALRRDLRRALTEVADVERILTRLTTATASGRDLNALRRTLRKLPLLNKILTGDIPALTPPAELPALLEKALSEEVPLRLSEGGVIREGYSTELDDLRRLARSGRGWISELETRERQRTGIGSLKIGFTSVFGYYLEVSRSNLPKVPPEWIRKQTLANAERFITPELKTQEDRILGAEEKARSLEVELFAQVRRDVLLHRDPLRELADALADLDAHASLAEAAERGRWTRPELTSDTVLELEDSLHPVVEAALARTGKPFVPNDVVFSEERRLLLITGPNMGGKSTYLRQAALAVILAQMGSYVPARRARVGLVDRVFTRIGAGDNLAAGASTFMVEMSEVAEILRHATSRSLIVLDEVGRGTSTYDGMAVAWAVAEQLSRAPAPRTLFATHYFELTRLAGTIPTLVNLHAAVREWTHPDGRHELVFLRRMELGPADRSYGVHVAQMAGVPAVCVDRAKVLLAQLENGRPLAGLAPETAPGPKQMDLFTHHPVLAELKTIDPDGITPMEALRKIQGWKDRVSL